MPMLYAFPPTTPDFLYKMLKQINTHKNKTKNNNLAHLPSKYCFPNALAENHFLNSHSALDFSLLMHLLQDTVLFLPYY